MAESYEATSTSLLMRVKENDSRAWERFVRLYSPLVHYWCQRSNLRAEDAADVLQDVFRAVSHAVEKFQQDHDGSFRGWLRTITLNKIRDHCRQQRHHPEAIGGTDVQQRLAEIPEDASGLGDEASHQHEKNLIWQQGLELVRQEFENSTWQAFWRVTIDDRVPWEVAAELGMTVNMVYKAKSRILRRLRQELGELLD